MSQGGDNSGLAEVVIDGLDAGQTVHTVTVHSARAANAFPATASQT